ALVIEHVALCAGQTGQCHGWLHRGGIHPDAEEDHADRLDRGARRWTELIHGAGRPGSLISCYVGGLHERTHTAVTDVGRRLGLDYGNTDIVDGGCDWFMRGPESAVVPLAALHDAVCESGVALRSAEAVSLISARRATRAQALLVRPEVE